MQPALLSSADLLVFAALALGLVMIPFGLPGLWVMVGAAALHSLAGPDEMGIAFLAILAAMALLAEAVEALLGVLAAKRFGATGWGMWGAFLGGVAGAVLLSPFFPGVGTLLGAFAGAFAGAFLLEWKKSRTFRAGWRAGTGAFVGRVAAVAMKTAVGFAIVVLVVLKIA